jgi:hypothetical protein
VADWAGVTPWGGSHGETGDQAQQGEAAVAGGMPAAFLRELRRRDRGGWQFGGGAHERVASSIVRMSLASLRFDGCRRRVESYDHNYDHIG